LISLSTITLRATAANCDDAFSVAHFLGDAGQRSGPGFNFHQVWSELWILLVWFLISSDFWILYISGIFRIHVISCDFLWFRVIFLEICLDHPGSNWSNPTFSDIYGIELDDGKIYRKALYLMVKTMVSCRFSLKPIHWLWHFIARDVEWHRSSDPSCTSAYRLRTMWLPGQRTWGKWWWNGDDMVMNHDENLGGYPLVI
jgi:hypothetical protein